MNDPAMLASVVILFAGAMLGVWLLDRGKWQERAGWLLIVLSNIQIIAVAVILDRLGRLH